MPKPKEINPIREKVKLLSQLGMTDKEAVKAHLVKETANITDPLKMEMRLDRVAHSMMMNFYDGDRQFVLTPKRKNK